MPVHVSDHLNLRYLRCRLLLSELLLFLHRLVCQHVGREGASSPLGLSTPRARSGPAPVPSFRPRGPFVDSVDTAFRM